MRLLAAMSRSRTPTVNHDPHRDFGTPVPFLSVTSKLCTAPQLQGSERLMSRILQLNKTLID